MSPNSWGPSPSFIQIWRVKPFLSQPDPYWVWSLPINLLSHWWPSPGSSDAINKLLEDIMPRSNKVHALVTENMCSFTICCAAVAWAKTLWATGHKDCLNPELRSGTWRQGSLLGWRKKHHKRGIMRVWLAASKASKMVSFCSWSPFP